MLYFWFVVAVVFVFGISTVISAQAKIAPEVRKNLPPEQIEIIQTELDARELWGVLLVLIAMFPVMIFLCLAY
jgi:hypothetical protein